MGATANRAFLVDGEPGGETGAIFAGPEVEGFTSWVTYALPREVGMVGGVVVPRLTNRVDDDLFGAGNDSMYWMEANATAAMLQWEWRARQLGSEHSFLLRQGDEWKRVECVIGREEKEAELKTYITFAPDMGAC